MPTCGSCFGMTVTGLVDPGMPLFPPGPIQMTAFGPPNFTPVSSGPPPTGHDTFGMTVNMLAQTMASFAPTDLGSTGTTLVQDTTPPPTLVPPVA
jgi:hypothetical protein